MNGAADADIGSAGAVLVRLASISASVGFGYCFKKAAAAMICPDWRYPHCGTSSASQACCTGGLASDERPSIVVTLLLATSPTWTLQDRMASPSTRTVQAPHCAMPQPNFVPVMPSSSRMIQSNGISASTSSEYAFPLTVSEIMSPRSLSLAGTRQLPADLCMKV